MGYLGRILPVFFFCWTTVLATLPTSYDVVWNRPGVNGSADSMPLGGGDIGLNTWYENGKAALNMYPLYAPANYSSYSRSELLTYSYTV